MIRVWVNFKLDCFKKRLIKGPQYDTKIVCVCALYLMTLELLLKAINVGERCVPLTMPLECVCG